MAVSLVSLVNQRLACCKALLPDIESSRTAVHHKALMDACLFHLVCGYQHYVRELGATYGIKNLGLLKDETSLSQALAQQGKTSAEVLELENLSSSPSSWLCELKGHYTAVWALPERAPDTGAIPLANLDEPELLELTPESLAQICREFQTLVARHRESSLEC